MKLTLVLLAVVCVFVSAAPGLVEQISKFDCNLSDFSCSKKKENAAAVKAERYTSAKVVAPATAVADTPGLIGAKFEPVEQHGYSISY